jgi:hypothetical protein
MKIIIIGNGFDLNLGLKTSYKDFIESNYFNLLLEKDNSLARHLSDKTQFNNWIDVENEITEYSTRVKDNNLIVKNNFIALKISLTSYLKGAQNKEINQNSIAFEMIKNEIGTTDKIFNFNYTNSIFQIAKILNITNIESKHSYVHGSVDNLDIILGVEDKAKINTNHIFLKKSYNINFGESCISKYLNDENDLILFGHSLGISDSSYFEDYINSLTSEYHRPKLKFYYFGETGYDELMKTIDIYTRSYTTEFIHNNEFIRIDSSKNN